MNSRNAIRKGLIPVAGPQNYMMQPYAGLGHYPGAYAGSFGHYPGAYAGVASDEDGFYDDDDIGMSGIVGDYWTSYFDWWKQQNPVTQIAVPAAFLYALYQIPAVKRRVKKMTKKKGR